MTTRGKGNGHPWSFHGYEMATEKSPSLQRRRAHERTQCMFWDGCLLAAALRHDSAVPCHTCSSYRPAIPAQ